MSTCKNCLKILVCKYNDGHNLFCKEDYKCPHFLDISVLEKQIPKKPDLEGDGYDENGELIYDTWICPRCGKYYEVYYEEYEFCPKCGQAIDWTE